MPNEDHGLEFQGCILSSLVLGNRDVAVADFSDGLSLLQQAMSYQLEFEAWN
jgi:hypothetical protein